MKVGVLGATGFTGETLVDILSHHPKAKITYLSSRTETLVPYSTMFPRFKKQVDIMCEPLDIEKASDAADIFFLSLPHTVSMQFAPKLLEKKKKVIDLSADYRLKDVSVYKEYYKTAHQDEKNLKTAVYGLGEIFKQQIACASLIANPGCYPTTVIVALYPLFKEGIIDDYVIVDSKSSITGAGRKANVEYHYSNISSNVWAYKPFVHQHVPEILEILNASTGGNVDLNFVPHVVGVEAGIYSTLYVSLKKKMTKEIIREFYDKYYSQAAFIRLCPDFPKLKDVAGTNFCDIGIAVDKSEKRCVIASCIDNLIKGAAGAAVQNMNIMMGWEETLGLL